MELYHLHEILDVLDSLALIEKEHPVIGEKLENFVTEIQDCCERAYNRLSEALSIIRSLSSTSTPKEFDAVVKMINQAPSAKWFKEVAGICDQLAVLARNNKGNFEQLCDYTSRHGNRKDFQENEQATRFQAHDKIVTLFNLLEMHERELKDDIRQVVYRIEVLLSEAKEKGNFSKLRNYATKVQKDISSAIDTIKQIGIRIKGTSSKGAEKTLDTKRIAKEVLSAPERMLILNMFFLIVIFALAALVIHYLAFYQFILITGFAITATVALNAFYLRSIDALSLENFMKLMRLALLQFFAPLTRRNRS